MCKGKVHRGINGENKGREEEAKLIREEVQGEKENKSEEIKDKK